MTSLTFPMTSLTLPMTSFSAVAPPLLSHRSKPHPSSSFIYITNTANKHTKIYSHNPNNSSKTLTNSKPLLSGKKLAVSAAAGVFLGIAGGADAGVWCGGGGGGGGGFWSSLFSRKAKAEEDESREYDSHGLPIDIVVELNELDDFKKYKLSEVIFFDESSKKVVGLDDEFFESFPIKTNGVYTKAQLMKGLETFAGTGIPESLDLTVKTKPDGTISVKLSFLESSWKEADRFKCISVGLLPQFEDIEIDENMSERAKSEYLRMHDREYRKYIKKSKACMLSSDVENEIMKMMSEQDKVTPRLLRRIRDRVEKWYHDNGYVLAEVVHFGNLDRKEVVCEVAEGDITRIVGQFQDKYGNVCEGKTQLGLIQRQFPDQLLPGNVFNIEAQRQALKNLDSLSLFSNIEVHPLPDEKQEGGIVVGITLKEDKQIKAGGFAKLPIAWHGFLPTLDSVVPGGNISFVYQNIEGLNRSIIGSVVSSSMLNPQDDLAFKLEYVHPYLDGVNNPRNRTLRTSCSAKRKISPLFTGRREVDIVPPIPIYVDRDSIEANINITENITNESKLTYGIVMEGITPHDKSGNIAPNGKRHIISDRKAYLQANMTRDNTKSVNGEIVGDRNVIQIEQGVGIGSSFPIFNRHQLTMTKFIQLMNVEEGVGKRPPPTLVLHTHYGGCVGHVASYDAFTLGGPYSVRGYDIGEIGDGTKKLELAAELRVPVVNTPAGNTLVYWFAEHGNDLGSSEDVNGNQRKGHGSSYGVGLKLGQLRAEYVVNHNSGTGGFMFGFGDRF